MDNIKSLYGEDTATWRVFHRVAMLLGKKLEQMTSDQLERIDDEIVEQIIGLNQPNEPTFELNSSTCGEAAISSSFNELVDSLLKLHDYDTYFRRFPYGKTTTTKHDYIQRCIEGYLQEVYIYRERFKAFVNAVSDYNQKPHCDAPKNLVVDDLFTLMKTTLRRVSKLRNLHVHKKRYDDHLLSRMRLVHLFLHSDEYASLSSELNAQYEEAYREAKRYWRALVKDNNAAITTLTEKACSRVEGHLPKL